MRAGIATCAGNGMPDTGGRVGMPGTPDTPDMPDMPLELFWLFRTVQNCSELFGVVWCYFIESRDPKALQLRTSAYGALETLSESQVP